MTRKCIEITAEILHVDATVRHGLGAVHEDGNAACAGVFDHALDRTNRAQRIRYVGDGYQEGSVVDEFQQRLDFDFAARVNWRDHEFRPRLLTDDLPGNDVRMVFEMGNDDAVTGLQARAAKTLGDEIDRLGRAFCQHDFTS